jgi:hypothetical protein
MWCHKEEEKSKLRYYKDVINPNLQDQKLSIYFGKCKEKNKHC